MMPGWIRVHGLQEGPGGEACAAQVQYYQVAHIAGVFFCDSKTSNLYKTGTRLSFAGHAYWVMVRESVEEVRALIEAAVVGIEA